MLMAPSTLTSITFANHPSLFPYDPSHTLRYLGLFTRCRISISLHVSSLKTGLRICIGDFFLVILSGVNFSCAVSTHTKMSYCVNDQKRVLILVLYTGACCVLMSLLIVSSTLGNADSFIFGYSAADNLGDRWGGITLSGGRAFMLLGSNGCWICLSTLGGGLVLLINFDAGWGTLAASFTLYYALNSLLVSSLRGLIQYSFDIFCCCLLFHWRVSVFTLFLVYMIILDDVKFCSVMHMLGWQIIKWLHLR